MAHQKFPLQKIKNGKQSGGSHKGGQESQETKRDRFDALVGRNKETEMKRSFHPAQ